MSSQEFLDFGDFPATSLSGSDSDVPSDASVPVHSRADSISGHGRHVVTCRRCGRSKRVKYEDAKFCSDACRYAWRHEKQGRKEARKKRRAMAGSARLHKHYLALARRAAHKVRVREGTADADRVRLQLQQEGVEIPNWSGWSGSIFSADPDYQWTYVEHRAAKHKGSKNREIKVWR